MVIRKYHGLGNDYLVMESRSFPSPALVQAICDRHRGPGGDGVLVEVPGDGADYGIRIFNPDGSEAEKSGNGLRIFARWLVDHRGAPAAFSVRTPGGIARCAVGDHTISVEMGRARIAPAIDPSDLDLPGSIAVAVPVNVGNPHLVLFTDRADLDDLPWRIWGERLERDPRFPNRINVQIARIPGPGSAELRIWERGAGETLASGSSSCAVAAAAVATGRLGAGEIRLEMPGGCLEVAVSPELDLTLRGPVEEVCEIRLAGGWLATRSR